MNRTLFASLRFPLSGASATVGRPLSSFSFHLHARNDIVSEGARCSGSRAKCRPAERGKRRIANHNECWRPGERGKMEPFSRIFGGGDGNVTQMKTFPAFGASHFHPSQNAKITLTDTMTTILTTLRQKKSLRRGRRGNGSDANQLRGDPLPVLGFCGWRSRCAPSTPNTVDVHNHLNDSFRFVSSSIY